LKLVDFRLKLADGFRIELPELLSELSFSFLGRKSSRPVPEAAFLA
jgi:hypothetical protein